MVETSPEEQVTFVRGDPAKLEAEVERIKQRGHREPVAPHIPVSSATVGLKTETVWRECRECGVEFQTEVLISGDKEIGIRRCAACSATVVEKTRQEAVQDEQKRIQELWEAFCPALYRDTDISRLGMAGDTKNFVLNWEPNPKGIGLAGESGAGKTRLMFLLLHKLHFNRVRCRAITAKRFEKWCHRMFEKDDDARVNIQSAHSVPVLFMDDIGKEKYTERVESEFYDLIEHRTSHLLPILWTANASGQQLVQMMGEDRGAPIVRRLREFSTVISV